MHFDFDKVTREIQNRFQKNESLKTFQELISNTIKDPHKYCRNSAQYMKDVFEHYGYYDVTDITGEPVRRWRIRSPAPGLSPRRLVSW